MPIAGERWRLWAGTVALAMTSAIVWPVIPDKDSFPLSNYPMFSTPKTTRAKIYHLVGFTPTGQGMPLSPSMLDTDEIMQAYQTAKLAIRGGRAQRLCEETALRVASSDDFADVTRVEVRIDVFDAVHYWEGDRSTEHSRVIAKCGVQR
ncbi:MAG: hypothetical protein ACRBN8_25875 [Nannocystales bacterium]